MARDKIDLRIIEEALLGMRVEMRSWRIHTIEMPSGEKYWLLEHASDWLGQDTAICRRFPNAADAENYVARLAMEAALVAIDEISPAPEEESNVPSDF